MDERTALWERRFQIPVIIAALLTLPLLVLTAETLPEPWSTVVDIVNWLSWGVFLLELVVVLTVSPAPVKWLRSHPLDVAVVVLTPPFLSVGAQSIRLVRVLRLLRLARLGPVMRRMLSLEGIRYASVLALITLVGGAEAFSAAEKVSIGNSYYWAITTMTTVGYGDIVPHTAIAKVVACVMMLVGTAFFALLTGAIAQRFLASTSTTLTETVQDTEGELLDQIVDIGDRLRVLETRVRQRAQAETAGAPPVR